MTFILLLSAIVFLESIHVLIAVSFLVKSFPLHSTLTPIILPEYSDHIILERDLSLYRLLVLFVIGIQGVVLWVWRKRLGDQRFIDVCCHWCIGLFIFTAMLLWWILSDLDHLQWPLILILIGAGHIGIWKRRAITAWWFRHHLDILVLKSLDIVVPVAIGAVLFIVDGQGAVAQIFVSDRFHHMDSFIAAPGWAAMSGLKLHVDTFSQYGLGMPFILGGLAQVAGGFDYVHILKVLVGMGILYFVIYYVFLRIWFKCALTATVGILLALKWHVFWPGASDFFIWKYPSATMVRYFFDGLFFICLMLHARHGRRLFLAGAALVNGLAIFYVSDTGIYLFLALVSYWFIHLLYASFSQGRLTLGREKVLDGLLLAVPLMTAFVLMFFVTGPAVLSGAFWKNFTEYIQLALGCFEALGIFWSFRPEYAGEFILGGAMLLVYLLTFAAVGSLAVLGKINKEKLILIPLCIYGLCTYQYFVFRSIPSNLYVVVIPFVSLTCYLFLLFLDTWFPAFRRRVLVFTVLVLAVMLAVSPAYLRYPNIFHGVNFTEQKQALQQRLDVHEDVRMIQSLTQSSDKVALISDHETAFLMRAKRKPFFYYPFLVDSRDLQMLDFGGMNIYTVIQLERVLRQLKEQHPQQVFISKKYILGELPEAYYIKFTALRAVVDYLRAHYDPAAEGRYLMALKRKL